MALSGQFALIVAAMFTGAAVYVNVAEQPARLRLNDQALLVQWKLAYKRGTAMQAPLALVGSLAAVMAWWQTGNSVWMLGAGVLIANWPYTLLVMMPTNRRLMATDPEAPPPECRTVIMRWSKLHSVRTGLGLAATVLFLLASIAVR